MKTLNLVAVAVLAYALIALTACSGGDAGSAGVSKDSPVYGRSYSFGAHLAQTMEQMGFTKEEQDVDKFVEGFVVGLKGDSAALAASQNVLRDRISTKTPSEGAEQAKEIAYNMGVSAIGSLASEIEIPESDFDMAAFKQGFVAQMEDDSLEFTKPEIDSVLMAYFTPKNEEYRAKMQAKQEAQAAVNIEKGKTFLAENATREGVTTLESGLQYEVIKEGSGAQPTTADKVKTHYHGTLIDGTIFDSSVDRGEPITFPLNGVIKGWQEGIPLMKVGAKYRLFVPQELAYGMQSPSPTIPAGSALIFEVELLDINPAE